MPSTCISGSPRGTKRGPPQSEGRLRGGADFVPLLVERTSAGASRPAKACGPDDGMPYRMNAVATTGMGGADRRPNREPGVLRQTDVKHCASIMLACCMAGQ